MNTADLPSPDTYPAATGPALPLFCLPSSVEDGRKLAAVYLVVDHCLPVLPGMALLQGWLADPDHRLRQLQAFSDTQRTAINVVPGLSLQARPDVDDGLRPVYAQDGIMLQGPTTVGFFALVPLATEATSVTLEALPHQGRPLVWRLPVCDNPTTRHDLLAPRSLRAWLPGALGWLLGDGMPPHLLPHLNELPAGAMHPTGIATTPGTHAHLEIDRVLRIGNGLFITGWSMDHSGRHHAQLLAQAKEAHTGVLCLNTASFPRPDVVAAYRGRLDIPDPSLGFVCWIPDVPGIERALHWRFWSADGQGGLIKRRVEVQDGRHAEATHSLLHIVPLTAPGFRQLYDQHIGPALEALFQLTRQHRQAPRVRTTQFGTPPQDPPVSIIVPLYGRWDFIEYQLSLLRHDPELRQHELIYFVDDPTIHDAILDYWRSTWPIYEVPFTLAYAGENLGFAGANNAAISIARGQDVLLLNSDVIPSTPGWLGTLRQALAEQPQAGAVGPALLYSDESVQHAGMEFERYPHWGGMWINLHPGKGWPASWLLQGGPREVPALTGACLLMRRALYLALGGLDEGYVRGDFEDSDLCLKLRAQGLKPYLVPQARLYHLERQSQDINAQATTRMLLTIYNCWRHTQRWDAAITRLMERPA